MTVSVLWLFLTVPWAVNSRWCVTAVFPGITHLLNAWAGLLYVIVPVSSQIDLV